MREENITVKGAEEKANRKGYITRAEIDELKEQLVQDMKAEAKDEIIRLLAGSIARNQNMSTNRLHQESVNFSSSSTMMSYVTQHWIWLIATILCLICLCIHDILNIRRYFSV